MRNVVLASDHAGYLLKKRIIEYLKEVDIKIFDFGCFSTKSSDYADFAHPLAEAVEKDVNTFGIVCCSSGNGINMTVNKHQGIRSALCWNVEVAKLARLHNDANICSLPSRFISEEKALKIIKIFMSTDFEGGRHITRIAKIPI